MIYRKADYMFLDFIGGININKIRKKSSFIHFKQILTMFSLKNSDLQHSEQGFESWQGVTNVASDTAGKLLPRLVQSINSGDIPADGLHAQLDRRS